MENNTATPLEADEIENKAMSIPEEAKAIIVTDDISFQKASRVLLTIKDLRKEINATFDPIIKKQFEAHREAVAQKKKVDAPLIEAENIIKPRIAAYHDEQERQRREEEFRLQEEARKKAEEEQLSDAVAAEQAGMSDVAESIMDEAPYTPTVVVPQKSTAKVDGVSFRESYKAQVFDIKALCRAVVEGKVPANVVMPDMTVLNGLARSLKGQLSYPGVKVVCEKVVAAGRR